jgi:hypothetical protein
MDRGDKASQQSEDRRIAVAPKAAATFLVMWDLLGFSRDSMGFCRDSIGFYRGKNWDIMGL